MGLRHPPVPADSLLPSELMKRWLRLVIAACAIVSAVSLGVLAWEAHEQTNELEQQTCWARSQSVSAANAAVAAAFGQYEGDARKTQFREILEPVDACDPAALIPFPTTTTRP